MRRKEQPRLAVMNTVKRIDYINAPVPPSPGADTISDSVKERYNMQSDLFFFGSVYFLLPVSAATLS